MLAAIFSSLTDLQIVDAHERVDAVLIGHASATTRAVQEQQTVPDSRRRHDFTQLRFLRVRIEIQECLEIFGTGVKNEFVTANSLFVHHDREITEQTDLEQMQIVHYDVIETFVVHRV